jgi:hypothetical protein
MWYSPSLAIALNSLFLVSPATLPPNGTAPSTPVTLCDAPTFTLPASIDLDRDLQPIARRTLEYSPTFRAQCRSFVRTTNLTATIRFVVRSPGSQSRARAVIRENPSGALSADIELGNGTDLSELLGHELEHVLEQLDGVDLSRMAKRGEARRLRDGTFETQRAIEAGHRVAGEVANNSPDRMRRAGRSAWRAFRRLMGLKAGSRLSRAASTLRELHQVGDLDRPALVAALARGDAGQAGHRART